MANGNRDSATGKPRNVDNLAPYPNERVEEYPTFLPKQQYSIGGLLPSEKFPQNANPPKLFEPIEIRGVNFVNRCWVAPMCQCERAFLHRFFWYHSSVCSWLSHFHRPEKGLVANFVDPDSSDYGHATDHHFVHTGSMAMRGWGCITIEATAVTPEGRISPEDAVKNHSPSLNLPRVSMRSSSLSRLCVWPLIVY